MRQRHAWLLVLAAVVMLAPPLAAHHGRGRAYDMQKRLTLKVGQPVTAIVNPAANGEPLGIVVKVVLPDGKEIMSRERGNPVD